MDRDVEVIHIERPNTVRTLRDQLAKLEVGTGFPILRNDDDGGSRMLGFIGGSELEHALSTPSIGMSHLSINVARVFSRHCRRGSRPNRFVPFT